MTNIQNILDLINENPNREVITMVETEVVQNDNSEKWIGSIGRADLDSYYMLNEVVYLLSDTDELVDIQMENLSNEYGNKKTTDELREIAKKDVKYLDWTKAIVINVGTY